MLNRRRTDPCLGCKACKELQFWPRWGFGQGQSLDALLKKGEFVQNLLLYSRVRFGGLYDPRCRAQAVPDSALLCLGITLSCAESHAVGREWCWGSCALGFTLQGRDSSCPITPVLYEVLVCAGVAQEQGPRVAQPAMQ